MLTPETIAEYQFRAIQKTVAWARHKSSYYAARLSAFPAEWPRSLDELAQVPLTSPADIVERGHEFLCVLQSEISRVVTLESSGTSGLRKRVFFTAEDQELALDFFAHGVAAMSAVGDRMGLGGGVDCHAHAGYHLREADLHFEIVSPTSDEPLGDGQMREVVFTTLGGVGMPLIRYRTGDLARIIPGRCQCGSPLRRMERVRNRVVSQVSLGPRGSITIAELDEAIFAIPGVHDFTAGLVIGKSNELQVQVYAPESFDRIAAEVKRTLMLLPAIGANCTLGELRVTVHLQGRPFPATGAKRKIGVQSAI